jgi:hypothetical protein
MLESAAVSTTKFITPAAAGMPTMENTRTKGLSARPTSVQGITPTSTAAPPM